MEETTTKKYTIANVVKKDPHLWFDRQREGVQKFRNTTGHETLFTGPSRFDGLLQAQVIEEVLEREVDALCVVPFFPQALERVLRKARKRGIVVITNEASNQRNNDYNIEAFDNTAYGMRSMDHLAGHMKKEGEYAIFLESLTTKAHAEWVEGSIARQQEKYPRMKLVAGKIEHQGEQSIASAKTKRLLRTYPNLKGILAYGMPAAPGAAGVIEEEGLQEEITIVGGGTLVSSCGQFLRSGSIELISFWDPADMGYMMNKLAVMVLNGESITDGMDLDVPGYTHINRKGKILYGSAWIDVTKDNMNEYDF